MTVVRARWATAAIIAVALLATSAPAATAAQAQRLYLLGDERGVLYWSTTPYDAEAPLALVTRTCGVRAPALPESHDSCFSYLTPDGTTAYAFDFHPAAFIDARPATTAEPLRFHFEVEVDSPLPATVHLATIEDEDLRVSPAATEVAPGVFEGTLSDPRALSGAANLLRVEVRTQSERIGMRLRTGGASWVELPAAVSARSVPQLLAVGGPTPVSSYTGANRTVRFNDGDWSAWSFEGDLTQDRTFDLDLPTRAGVLLAWVQTFDSPLVYDLARGRDADPRELENAPSLRVLRGTSAVAEGNNSGHRGRGQDAAAALDVGPGPLTVEVSDGNWDPDGGGQELPYTVHVVAVHGPRTLAGMRWSFSIGGDAMTPVVGQCAYGLEPIPVTRDVSTFRVGLDWDSAALPAPDWTLWFNIGTGEYVCGETGDERRFTYGREHGVRLMGPVPERSSLHSSFNDTVFEMDVQYAYHPAA